MNVFLLVPCFGKNCVQFYFMHFLLPDVTSAADIPISDILISKYEALMKIKVAVKT